MIDSTRRPILLPKYRAGKDDDIQFGNNTYRFNPETERYYDKSGSPVKFVQGGMLPEATVTPSMRLKLDHPLVWKDVANRLYTNTDKERAIRDTTPTKEALSAISGGMLDMNRLSISQNARFLYDLAKHGNTNIIYGNNGVVSDKFAEESPFLSFGYNFVVDAPFLLKAIANPSMLRFAENAADNLGRNLGKTNVGKRLVETLGQTADVDPSGNALKYLRKDAIKDLPHFANTVKYILTGTGDSTAARFARPLTLKDMKKMLSDAYYKPILDIPEYGFDRATNPYTGYLRALLYKEEPGSDLSFIGTADKIDVGPHYKTILQRGYNPKDVRVYTTGVDNSRSILPTKESLVGNLKYITTTAEGPITTKSGTFDSAGHLHLKRPDGKVMQLDFTDFNFDAYNKKWLGDRPINNILPSLFRRFGLKLTDSATTPIIVRSPWKSHTFGENFWDEWTKQQKYFGSSDL